MATTADRKKLRDAKRKPKPKTPAMPKDPKGVGAGFADFWKDAPGGRHKQQVTGLIMGGDQFVW